MYDCLRNVEWVLVRERDAGTGSMTFVAKDMSLKRHMATDRQKKSACPE